MYNITIQVYIHMVPWPYMTDYKEELHTSGHVQYYSLAFCGHEAEMRLVTLYHTDLNVVNL